MIYCHYPYPCHDASRKDYLLYLILSFVATPEEQAEYRDMKRNFVEQYWNNEIDRQIKYNAESVEKDISYYKKLLIGLRSTIEGLEYANKVQEYINYMEAHRVRAGEVPTLQGFVFGWG